MLFHEALRLGSMTTEKTRFTRHAHNGAKCALGAAEFAMGQQWGTPFTKSAEDMWPFIQTKQIDPITGDLEKVNVIIASLNNGVHGKEWTREAIADWIQPLEEAWMAQQAQQTKTEELVTA